MLSRISLLFFFEGFGWGQEECVSTHPSLKFFIFALGGGEGAQNAFPNFSPLFFEGFGWGREECVSTHPSLPPPHHISPGSCH